MLLVNGDLSPQNIERRKLQHALCFFQLTDSSLFRHGPARAIVAPIREAVLIQLLKGDSTGTLNYNQQNRCTCFMRKVPHQPQQPLELELSSRREMELLGRSCRIPSLPVEWMG